jgi:hypothetical protein
MDRATVYPIDLQRRGWAPGQDWGCCNLGGWVSPWSRFGGCWNRRDRCERFTSAHAVGGCVFSGVVAGHKRRSGWTPSCKGVQLPRSRAGTIQLQEPGRPVAEQPPERPPRWRGTGGDVQVFDRPSSLTAARKTVGSAAAAGTMACRAHAGRVACTRACVIAAYRQLAWRPVRS